MPQNISRRTSRKLSTSPQKAPLHLLHVFATRVGIGVTDEKWFDTRLTLLEHITIPSMQNQTCQNFFWLLVIGDDMPVAARQRLEQSVSGFDRAIILESSRLDQFMPTVRDWIHSQNWPKPWVMTSRIDDDDALRFDAVEVLQLDAREFFDMRRVDPDGPRRAVFSFNRGARWVPHENIAVDSYHCSIGIGLSYLERIKRPLTVYAFPHKRIKTRLAGRGIFIKEHAGAKTWWIYTNHLLSDTETSDADRVGSLVSSQYAKTPSLDHLAAFGIKPESLPILAKMNSRKSASAGRPTFKRIKTEAEIARLKSRDSLSQEDVARLRRLEHELESLGVSLVE